MGSVSLKKDMRAVVDLARVLNRLDELVFPDNPIKKIYFLEKPPRKNHGYICYGPKKSRSQKQPEHYAIFRDGLAKEVVAEVRNMKVLERESLIGLEDKKRPKINSENIFISMAIHDIRHRVQQNLPVRLFSPKDLEKVSHPLLKNIIEAEILVRQEDPLPAEADPEREFDANVVEYYVSLGWCFGEKDLSKLATMIKIEPQHFY